MLGQEWLPTPLENRNNTHRVEIRARAPQKRFPFWRMIGAFIGYALTNQRNRLAGRNDPDERAVRLRLVFEELGGLWIKIGQLLSLRTDVFSPAVCRELSRLQHRAIGFPVEEARSILRAELGVEIESVFVDFDPEPLAAASISQVHRARLRSNGVEVAVKVRRPEAKDAFERDLAHIRGLVRFFNILRLAPHIHLADALWELEQMVQEELDFRYEAANTRRMRKSLRAHGIYVPKVFQAQCSRNILTTEYIGGVLMSDYISCESADPEGTARWRLENGINPRKVGKRLLHSIMRQLLEDNLFHADIHPGNILLLRDSRFAFIDFGVIGTCEREFLTNYKISLLAMAQKDFGKAADVTLRFAIAPPALTDIKKLRKEMMRSFRSWESRSYLEGMGYHERSLSSAGMESGRIMARYKVQLSWEFMRISRTWGTLDASLNYMIPNANYIDLFAGYFRSVRRRQMAPRTAIQNMASAAGKVIQTAREIKVTLEPQLRRQALVSSAIGSFSERALIFVAGLFRFMRTGVVLALGFALLLFMDQFHPHTTGEQLWLSHLADDVEGIDYEWWVVGLMAAILGVIGISRAIKSLERNSG